MSPVCISRITDAPEVTMTLSPILMLSFMVQLSPVQHITCNCLRFQQSRLRNSSIPLRVIRNYCKFRYTGGPLVRQDQVHELNKCHPWIIQKQQLLYLVFTIIAGSDFILSSKVVLQSITSAFEFAIDEKAFSPSYQQKVSLSSLASLIGTKGAW